MPQYFSPGVYVEEVDSGPRPIQGVSTSVTGAVGVTARGPTKGKPRLVTSFNEFHQLFGGFLPDPSADIKADWDDKNGQRGVWWKFPNAVRGFFDNGGQQLYVKRVVSSKATPSSAELNEAVVSEILNDADKDATRLTVRHVLGLDADTNNNVKVVDGQSGVPILTTTVTQYQIGATESTIEINVKLPREVSASRGDYLVIRALNTGQKRLRIKANSEGEWGDDVRVRVRPIIGATLKLRHDEGAGGQSGSGTLAKEALATGNRKIELEAGHTLAADNTVRINGHKYTLSGGVESPGKNAIQSLSFTDGTPTSGGFTLTFVGQTTASIPFNATAADVQAKLVALGNIGAGQVTCSGGALPGTPLAIEFTGTLGNQNVPAVTAAKVDLDAGVPSVTVTTEGNRATTVFDVIPIGQADSAKWEPGFTVQKLRPAISGDTISVSGAGRLYTKAMIELNNGVKKLFFNVTSVEGDVVTLNSAPPAEFVEDDQVLVIEAEMNVQYAPGGEVVEDELFTNLKLASDDKDDPLLITNRVTRRSNLIVAEVDDDGPITLSNAALADFPGHGRSRHQSLTNGDNGYRDLLPDDFIGQDRGSGNRSGIKSMEDIEDISLVMAPGMWARSIINELTRHSEAMKYRMAIFDAPLNADLSDVQAFRAQFDSKYAAMYYPWINSRQPGVEDDVPIPPSGHMAGIYSDVDTRRGVHKAPANEVIRGITEINQDVTRREQDLLNPKGINALRFFPGRGNLVWGARTISSDSNFRYINVRRIFNFIERSIDEGTQFVVFEPNEPQLWSRVRQTINNFLNTQWRAGMLEGRTSEEAYFVACDRGLTMTQDDIENGRLICEVGIAPVFPAEFVIFRIQKFTADSKLA